MPISLNVTLQRPNALPPHLSWAVPVHFALYPPGDPDTICHEWDLTLDESGQWVGGELPGGPPTSPLSVGAQELKGPRELERMPQIERKCKRLRCTLGRGRPIAHSRWLMANGR
jgi:hypothetical protein